MADLGAVKFVESYKLERFITDGLNSGKFGHSAVEILSEIYVLETSDVAPVVHARWEVYPNDAHRRCTACKTEFESVRIRGTERYCPNCGAKMDGEEKR